MDSCTLEVFLCNPAGAQVGARTRAVPCTLMIPSFIADLWKLILESSYQQACEAQMSNQILIQ
jgi:hypothetical protein